jgi:hypothetical protein
MIWCLENLRVLTDDEGGRRLLGGSTRDFGGDQPGPGHEQVVISDQRGFSLEGHESTKRIYKNGAGIFNVISHFIEFPMEDSTSRCCHSIVTLLNTRGRAGQASCSLIWICLSCAVPHTLNERVIQTSIP